jgi:hypothetical protein
MLQCDRLLQIAWVRAIKATGAGESQGEPGMPNALNLSALARRLNIPELG